MNSRIVLSSLFSSALLIGASQAMGSVVLTPDSPDTGAVYLKASTGAEPVIFYTPELNVPVNELLVDGGASSQVTSLLTASHFQWDFELARTDMQGSYASLDAYGGLVTFQALADVDYVLDGLFQSAQKDGKFEMVVALVDLDLYELLYYKEVVIYGNDTVTERSSDLASPDEGSATGTLTAGGNYGLQFLYGIDALGAESYELQTATGFLSLAFVPEPSSALGALAAAGFMMVRRRRC